MDERFVAFENAYNDAGNQAITNYALAIILMRRPIAQTTKNKMVLVYVMMKKCVDCHA